MQIPNYNELKLIILNLKKITLKPNFQRKKVYIPNKIRKNGQYKTTYKTTKATKNKGQKFFLIFLLASIILLGSGFFYFQKIYSNSPDSKIAVDTKKRINKLAISADSAENLENNSNNQLQTNENSSLGTATNSKDPSLFEKKLSEIMKEGSKPDNYGIYLSEFSSGYSFGINENKIFYPASISKLPIAILILRDLENKKLNLTDKIELKDENKAYESDEMYNIASGTFFPISTYLKKMVSQSDNTAMTTLEEILGGSEKINLRTKNELEIANLSRFPHVGTGKDIGKLLENLYNNIYLNSQNTEYLLEMMVDVAKWFQDRIPAGLPDNIEVAHKVGQIETDGGVVFADCGIIFGRKKDFVLVFVNQDIAQEEARLKIIEITKLAYNFFEE